MHFASLVEMHRIFPIGDQAEAEKLFKSALTPSKKNKKSLKTS
jgi:hypothetical protein